MVLPSLSSKIPIIPVSNPPYDRLRFPGIATPGEGDADADVALRCTSTSEEKETASVLHEVSAVKNGLDSLVGFNSRLGFAGGRPAANR